MEKIITIHEIKKPVTIDRIKYTPILTEEGERILIKDDYPFPAGTVLRGTVAEDYDTIPLPLAGGLSASKKEDWIAYYRNHILSDAEPINLPPETQKAYVLYQKLQQVTTTKEGAFYFLNTFGPDSLVVQEKLETDPYWFYGYYHQQDWNNFRKINRQTEVDTFALRLSQCKSCIAYLLLSNEKQGNTWMHFDKVLDGINLVMQNDDHAPVSKELLFAILNEEERFYFDGEHVALQSAYDTEEEILRNVRLLQSVQPLFHEEVAFENHLCEEQRVAVDSIINGGNISILTGGPGTGKTTTIATILRYYIGTVPIALLAPTAKAVQRMRESLQEEFSTDELEGLQISTIHKFLGYGLPRFLQAQAISDANRIRLCIIDEMSMPDIYLFSKLLQSLDLGRCKMVLVGDKNQLPSIYAGNILTDLIQIGVPTYRLEVNHRSVKSIYDNGNLILNNNQEAAFTEDEHFLFLPEDRLQDVLQLVDFSREDVILLSPYRKPTNRYGQPIPGNTTDINTLVHQRRFGMDATGYQIGEKVMCMHNNYKANYFNGEVGFVLAKDSEGYSVDLGEEKTVRVSDIQDLDYAYASTVHKAQGSEYQEVYIYLPDNLPEGLLNRELLYTAVTRAKQKCTVLGSKETLYKIMQTSASCRRTFMSMRQEKLTGVSLERK